MRTFRLICINDSIVFLHFTNVMWRYSYWQKYRHYAVPGHLSAQLYCSSCVIILHFCFVCCPFLQLPINLGLCLVITIMRQFLIVSNGAREAYGAAIQCDCKCAMACEPASKQMVKKMKNQSERRKKRYLDLIMIIIIITCCWMFHFTFVLCVKVKNLFLHNATGMNPYSASERAAHE